MNIIIAGGGKVGSLVAKQLASDGHNIVVIDSCHQVLEKTMEDADVMTIEGNAATLDVLEAASIDDADLVIAATGRDDINLLTCMTAHGKNPDIQTIARVRAPEYARTAEVLRERMSLTLDVNPEKQTAREIESILRYPGFLWREEFSKGLVEIVSINVKKEMPICDQPLNKLSGLIRCRVIVCTVLRGNTATTPNGDFILREGDRIYVTAPSTNLSTLLHSLHVIKKKIRNVVITGGGKIAFYLAKLLEKENITVKIIDRDRERCEELSVALPNASIICGDVSMQPLLEQERVSEADAFISLTNMDELNVITSLYADSVGVPIVVTKLGRGENFTLVKNLPVGSVISPKELCGNTILRFVRAMENGPDAAVALHTIADGNAEAYEFIVEEKTPFINTPLKRVKFRENVLITCIIRGRKIEFPTGDSVYKPGDHLVVVSNASFIIKKLSDIF